MKKQNFLLNGKNQFLPTEIEEEKNLDPGKLVFAATYCLNGKKS